MKNSTFRVFHPLFVKRLKPANSMSSAAAKPRPWCADLKTAEAAKHEDQNEHTHQHHLAGPERKLHPQARAEPRRPFDQEYLRGSGPFRRSARDHPAHSAPGIRGSRDRPLLQRSTTLRGSTKSSVRLRAEKLNRAKH